MLKKFLSVKAICILCKQKHPRQHGLCPPCTRLLTPRGSACVQCAVAIPSMHAPHCGHCLQKKPAYDRILTAYRFEEPLRTLVHEFKYQEGFYLTDFLIHLMLEAQPHPFTQCLIPMPMHPQRLQHRGYNQAVLLAKGLSKALSIPYNTALCQKKINTPAQASLSAPEREKNVLNAFSAHPSSFEHLTIIDDVVTTGHTVNALAHALKAQGIKIVDVWCCARA